MLRSFSVAATLVVYPTEGSMQFASCTVVQALYLFAVCFLAPYRKTLLTETDATITLSMLGVCAYGAIGVASTEADVDQRLKDYGVFFVLSLLVALCIPVYIVVMVVTRGSDGVGGSVSGK